MSLLLRDQCIRECWVYTSLRKPQPDHRGLHYPVQVWGVVEDERFVDDQCVVKRFADVVTYWPALGIWTVSMCCREDDSAVDVKVNVTMWQPLPPLRG